MFVFHINKAVMFYFLILEKQWKILKVNHMIMHRHIHDWKNKWKKGYFVLIFQKLMNDDSSEMFF